MKARGPDDALAFGVDFLFDAGGVALTALRITPPIEIPSNCRIIGCRIVVGQTDARANRMATATFNILRGTFGDYPSMSLLHDTTSLPKITAAFAADPFASVNWTTKQLIARDWVACQLATLSTVGGAPQQLTVALLLRRTPPLIVHLQDGAGNTISDGFGNPILGGQ